MMPAMNGCLRAMSYSNMGSTQLPDGTLVEIAPEHCPAAEPVKVVSERLGHASPMITLGVYTHTLPGMQRHAANRLAAIVLGS
jgi:hypothetical protein